MKLPLYNIEGKELKKIDLPDEIFNLPWNGDLVHQVVTSILSNARNNVAHTKDRSDVSGGGKKPWRQKGTGRARHGSNRSPIWRGGGITFGPINERNFVKKINKKMRIKALAVTLSQKIRDNELILLEPIKISEAKTVKAKEILEALSKNTGFEKLKTKRKNSAILGMFGRDENTEKSFRNFSNISIEEVRNFNPATILNHKYLMIENAEESLKSLVERLGKISITDKQENK